mmetsp:Transcript_102787/g.329652  ORF Transcript_102787/g.329652 Transcript_102787/m.329652 type:complete len:342 (+) Transcript_102787:183-1208(+)
MHRRPPKAPSLTIVTETRTVPRVVSSAPRPCFARGDGHGEEDKLMRGTEAAAPPGGHSHCCRPRIAPTTGAPASSGASSPTQLPPTAALRQRDFLRHWLQPPPTPLLVAAAARQRWEAGRRATPRRHPRSHASSSCTSSRPMDPYVVATRLGSGGTRRSGVATHRACLRYEGCSPARPPADPGSALRGRGCTRGPMYPRLRPSRFWCPAPRWGSRARPGGASTNAERPWPQRAGGRLRHRRRRGRHQCGPLAAPPKAHNSSCARVGRARHKGRSNAAPRSAKSRGDAGRGAPALAPSTASCTPCSATKHGTRWSFRHCPRPTRAPAAVGSARHPQGNVELR